MSARRVEAAGRPAQLAGGASREYPHDGLGVLSDHRGDLRVGIAGSPTLAHLRQDDLLVFVGNEPLLDNVVSERPLAAAVDALIGQMALQISCWRGKIRTPDPKILRLTPRLSVEASKRP